MPATPWEQQVAYYRARAAEYEATSYRDVHRADQRMAALVRHLQPVGDLLEIGCGTGLWTRHLAGCAATVTAIDATPEMIALARQRITAHTVTFVTADVLTWAPPRRFDTILFALWLSYVPASEFGQFWSMLRTALASGGAACCLSTTSPRPPPWRPTWRDLVRSWSGACATEPATGSSR